MQQHPCRTNPTHSLAIPQFSTAESCFLSYTPLSARHNKICTNNIALISVSRHDDARAPRQDDVRKHSQHTTNPPGIFSVGVDTIKKADQAITYQKQYKSRSRSQDSVMVASNFEDKLLTVRYVFRWHDSAGIESNYGSRPNGHLPRTIGLLLTDVCELLRETDAT